MMEQKMEMSLTADAQVVNEFHATTQAILTYADSIGAVIPTTTLSAYNTLVAGLVSDGVLSIMDICYIFATDGDRKFASINIANLGAHDCTDVGTPTFTAKLGFNTLGNVANHLTTNFIPAVNGVNYTLNNAHLFSYIPSAPVANGANQCTIGCRLSTNRAYIMPINSTNGLEYQVNQNSLSNHTLQGSGVYIANRIVNTGVNFLLGGVIIDTETDASVGLPNTALRIGAYNNNGTLDSPYNGYISAAGAGGSALGIAANLNSRLLTYYSTINP